MRVYTDIKNLLFIASLSIVSILLFSCQDDDTTTEVEGEFAVSVSGEAQVPNSSEVIDLSSSFILSENTKILILEGLTPGNGDISYLSTGVGLSTTEEPVAENKMFRIRFFLCDDTDDSFNSATIDQLFEIINSDTDDSFIFLEMFYNGELYMNLDLEDFFGFDNIIESGCGLLMEADNQAEIELSIDAPTRESENVFIPASYSYKGYLYTLERLDSIFIEGVEVNFPIQSLN